MVPETTPEMVISHWSTLIENFQTSPLGFYQAVEEALKRRQVPETKNSRVDYKQAGLLSPNREYLHVTREKLVFDICGAPFGTGFFVSWWLAEARLTLNPLVKVLAVVGMLAFTGVLVNMAGIILGLLLTIGLMVGGLAIVNAVAADGEFDDDIVRALPLLGWLYERLFKPSTYYRIDTMLMFQKAVHNAVLEVIDTMTQEKGVRALSDADRRPIMREFYSRAA